jgi:hypothetical protein
MLKLVPKRTLHLLVAINDVRLSRASCSPQKKSDNFLQLLGREALVWTETTLLQMARIAVLAGLQGIRNEDLVAQEGSVTHHESTKCPLSNGDEGVMKLSSGETASCNSQ